jgi:hypothetical protein
LSYCAFVIISFLILANRLLPGFGVVEQIVNILDLIKDILLLIILVPTSFYFIRGKKKWVKILYWIAVVVFVSAILMNFI